MKYSGDSFEVIVVFVPPVDPGKSSQKTLKTHVHMCTFNRKCRSVWKFASGARIFGACKTATHLEYAYVVVHVVDTQVFVNITLKHYAACLHLMASMICFVFFFFFAILRQKSLFCIWLLFFFSTQVSKYLNTNVF